MNEITTLPKTSERANVTVRYFASVRERIGLSSELVLLPSNVVTVGDFIEFMRSHGPAYEAALSPDLGIRTAVNRQHVSLNTRIAHANEIAFFPMMTGG